jgi:Tfp pilus assembly protein PilN
VYGVISRSIAIIFVFAAIFSGLLAGSSYYLEARLDDILVQNATEINKVRELGQSIKQINGKIDAAANTQSEYRRWSPLLIKLSQLTPDEIYFEELRLYQQENLIEIKGVAKTRNDLINYQKNLDGSGLFKKTELPLEALISKENNSFNIKATPDLNQLP